MHTTLRTPSAAAPSRSACRASRFRSRQTSCITGSTPMSRSSRAAAIAAMCAWAALLSVQFTASTFPRRVPASSATRAGSAESLVWSSAVTTNSPACSRRCRWLRGAPSVIRRDSRPGSLSRSGPPPRHVPVAPRHQVLPRRRPLQAPVDGRLHVLDVVAPQRKAPRALPRGDPDALHLGHHLAAPVLQRAAAGAVPQVLGAAHRTRQPRRVQDALPAHATVPHGLLRDAFDEQEGPPEARGRGRRLRGPSVDPGSLHLRSLRCSLVRTRPSGPYPRREA